MKIIFLNHQGVMYLRRKPDPGLLHEFDRDCVSIIQEIIEKDSSIEIVVSSNWQDLVPLHVMQHFYRRQGLKAPIAYTERPSPQHDSTPEQRAMEIRTWLLKSTGVKRWVAIDEYNLKPHLFNSVWTEPTFGIKQPGVKEELLQYLI